MSFEKSDSLEAMGDVPVAETPVLTGPKETPRKRYAPPSAPRVLRCMQPVVKS